MDEQEIDIGEGVSIRYVGWFPDRDLNPQYDGLPDVERYGVIVRHMTSDGKKCRGFVTFDSSIARQIAPTAPKWTVENEEPLTISPSVLCRACGHHGFIREGKWVPS